MEKKKIKILDAIYDIDTNTFTIVDLNHNTQTYDLTEIEDSIDTNLFAMSKIEQLQEDKPIEFMELYLNNELQHYADIISNNIDDISIVMFNRYKTKYPDMSNDQIHSLIREFNMYSS